MFPVGCGGGSDNTTTTVKPTTIAEAMVGRDLVTYQENPVAVYDPANTTNLWVLELWRMHEGLAYLDQPNVVTDPGTSTHAIGDIYCTTSGTVSVANVADKDPLVRQRITFAWDADDCGSGAVGTSEHFLFETVKSDADGLPDVVVAWRTLADDAVMPTLANYNGGDAKIIHRCAADQVATGAGECNATGTCKWALDDTSTGYCPNVGDLL